MSISLSETGERIMSLYRRKLHADAMPAEREKNRGLYELICSELRAECEKYLYALPIDLLPADNATACELCMLLILSQKMFKKPFTADDISLWLITAEGLLGLDEDAEGE